MRVPLPSEETLEALHRTPGRIQEVWGYVSDGHTVVPTYLDRIVEARSHGENLLRYVEGLSAHLGEPLKEIEIRPAGDGETAPPWKFLLRRQPRRKGVYPVRWEVYSGPEVLLRIEGLISELDVWDSLPCRLRFD